MTVIGEITLPGVKESVRCARIFVRATLWDVYPHWNDVALVVSELATNGVLHGPDGDGGKIKVTLLTRDDRIRAEVTNDGTTASGPRVRNDVDAEDGRGLFIVACLAHDWGVIEDAATTTVWAEFTA